MARILFCEGVSLLLISAVGQDRRAGGTPRGVVWPVAGSGVVACHGSDGELADVGRNSDPVAVFRHGRHGEEKGRVGVLTAVMALVGEGRTVARIGGKCRLQRHTAREGGGARV